MLRILCFILFVQGIVMAQNTPPYRQTLTSVKEGIHLDTWQITSHELGLKTESLIAVGKYALHGGKQEGVDVIELDNGKIRITIIPTRGMGILKVEAGDVRLGWDSPVKEVVHPQFINLASRGGLGWLEGFNEWMVRCGFEWAGHPGKDKFINNVGDEAEMDLTLHGKIANIPASEVEVLIERQPPYRMTVRGRVDERMFYGPKLEVWTELSTEPGSSTFRISDTVTNYSAFEQEYQVIYHANYGAPLLGKGSKFVAPVKQVTPFNAHAAKGIGNWTEYTEPIKGFIEQVYCVRPYADAGNRTMMMLHNAASDRAVTMSFLTDQLPYVTLWKNTNDLKEGYVTGLEPGTGFPYNRRIERRFGRVPKLAPGAKTQFVIDVTIHQNRESIALAAEQIRRIQAGRKTQTDAEPVKID